MSAVKVALIGVGRRGRAVYLPVLEAIKDELELVALCDRQRESAGEAAEQASVPAFHSVRDLVAAGIAEAAIVCTPVESHHAISAFLSRHGIHHVVETTMAVTRRQCREMAQAAAENGVVLHVNEQFFRREVIAFSRQIIAAGVIGDVRRITIFHGHTGYHNNSIIQFYTGSPPVAVNSVEHAMPLRRYLDGAGRWQEQETFRLRAMQFANGVLVTDAAGNIKSAMGRCPRPGYMEIDGTGGTIVEQPCGRPAPWEGKAEVRLVAQEDLERGGYAQSYPIERVTMVGRRVNISDRLPWDCHYHKLRVRLPGGALEYANPMLRYGITHNYLSTVAQSTLDFARALRGGRQPEFTVEMAIASQEMDAACGRSAAGQGRRVELPLPEEDTPEEQAALEAMRKRFGVDPMDAEAVLEISFPRNYEPEAG